MSITSHKGFTLLELMIVITTIAILSAIAIPAYQSYIIRTEISEGLTLASSAQIAVIEAYTSTAHSFLVAYSGNGPTVANSYPYSYTPSTFVESIAINAIDNTAAPTLPEGRITITYSQQLNTLLGASLLLTPGSGTVVEGLPSAPIMPSRPIVWGCAIDSEVAFRYVPASCRFLP